MMLKLLNYYIYIRKYIKKNVPIIYDKIINKLIS